MDSNSIQRAVKRTLDLGVSLVLFIALLPVALTAVLGIWLQDREDPFYSQVRVGERGRLFRMWKFRTMVSNADALRREVVAGTESIRFKKQDDPRITPVGRVLRRWSIDELPQLYNVIRGDMSLVGPRPPLPEEVEKYTDEQRGRLEATPGLTGPWQVGGRSELDFHEQVKLDLEYVRGQSLWGDVKLLARTVPAVLTGRGAW
jgi:lipopolysaccharide/colanic/teichoic acid biosynthesis glycosyltransferase